MESVLETESLHVFQSVWEAFTKKAFPWIPPYGMYQGNLLGKLDGQGSKRKIADSSLSESCGVKWSQVDSQGVEGIHRWPDGTFLYLRKFII